MILFISIDTIGLPSKYNPYYKKLEFFEDARLIGVQLNDKRYIIKPTDFKLMNTEIHGITPKMIRKNGMDIEDFFKIFAEILSDTNLIVSHNISFVLTILKSELYRYNNKELVDKLFKVKKYCTMKESTNILKISSINGKSYKFPKWKELCNFYYPKKQDISIKKIYNKLIQSHQLVEVEREECRVALS